MTATTHDIAGTRLHLDDTGESDLDPVLCLHSLFFDNRMFDDLVAAGAGRFRFIRPEYRGQGRSAPADRDIVTIEQVTADVAALMDQIGVTNAQVVGSSMGGDVAVRLAVYRPDLVRSLVFLGSSARSEPADQLDGFRVFVDDVGENGFTGERYTMVESIMLGESTRTDPAKKDVVDLWGGRLKELTPALKPAILGVILRRGAVDTLPEIDVPALVISGEECPVRPPEWAKELADGLPGAELVMIPRSGHSPLLEAPDTVIPQVLEFLAAHG